MAIEPQTPRITKSTIDKQRDLIEIYDASTGVMKVTTPGDLAQENPEGFLQIKDGVTIDSTPRYVVDKDGTQSPLLLSTDRLGIDADPTATTQAVAVIESTSTNAGIVLKPNGTGAIMAQVPDGTATGGNARGIYSVDFQMSRTAADQVAFGTYGFIGGGKNNKIQSNGDQIVIAGGQGNIAGRDYATIGGGLENTISALTNGSRGTIGGGESNVVSSDYSTISGGQSNTASTSSYATVVGGYQNTASGQYSVAGGQNNVASGLQSVAGGYFNTASNNRTVALGDNNNVSGIGSVAVGSTATITGTYSGALGGRFARVSSAYSVVLGGNLALSYLYNQLVTNSSSGTVDWGDTQSSQLLSYRTATLSSAATTVLSLDGTGTTNLLIPYGTKRAWNVTVKWVAVCTATGSGTTAVGDVAIATDSFMFKKVSGTSSIGSVQNLQNSQDATMAGATCSYAVGGSQDLQITFTAPASANATTFRVVAKVELTEVTW